MSSGKSKKSNKNKGKRRQPAGAGAGRPAGGQQSARGQQPARDSQGAAGPRCPVARECGACPHVNEPYDRQLARKDARMAELFSQVASADAPAAQPAGGPQVEAARGSAAAPQVLRPIIGMEDPYHYRNKVSTPFAPGRKLPAGAPGATGAGGHGAAAKRGGSSSRAQAPRREILCGMYAPGTHHIVRTDDCLVENVEAKRIVLAVRDLMPRFGIEPYDEDAGTGLLRHVVVRVGHESGEILVTLVTNGEDFPAPKAFCRELVRRCPGITTVVQNINERQTNVILGEGERRLYGPGFILDRLCGLSFRISSQSFYQVNATQTEVLYEQAVGLAGLSGSERVVDAYCGTGTIGLVAAKAGAGEVVGVDTVESAIRDARQNAAHNGVENARFVVGDAGEFMEGLAAEGERVDVLLMDPPRAGASRAFLDAAARLAPARVVYISCNPETQLRDLRVLLEAGYALRAVQPVDMFPHTDHIESVALLVRG